MPPTAAADATHFLLHHRRVLEQGVLRWLQRLPRRPTDRSPREILDDIHGALWLELTSSGNPFKNWRRCLRRVLYVEFERTWQHSHRCVDGCGELWLAKAAHNEPQELDLPQHLQAWAAEYLRRDGPQGRLDRGVELCGSRRQTRLRNSALFRALSEGQWQRDLERRAARLMAAVAVDGASAAHQREARAILCMLKMLDASPKHATMRASVSGIVAVRKPANHAGKAGSANA